MIGTELHDLEVILSGARSELSPIKARLALTKVAQRCQSIVREDPKLSEFALVGSSALAELATLELSPERRLDYRRRAIRIFRESMQDSFSPALATSRANRVVDLFYDPYAGEEASQMRNLLSTAASALSQAILRTSISAAERASLLIQRSSVLRCQALMSQGKELTARIQEAVRSATRATEDAPQNRFAKLELGQALWASARVAATDEDCFKALQSAERALLDSRDEEEPLPYLVLARFYRHSNRPALAVDIFREYDQREKINRRRLLGEAFLVGESAMLLWYSDYEASVVEEALTYAETTLLESVDAGYEIARNFTSLAFVQAALGRSDMAEHTLRRLSPENTQSWIDLIEQAESAITRDDLSAIGQAFALGVDDATVWNALGTFAARFFRDDQLALRLYNIARRLDPNNAVVLTNLARIYLRQGKPEDLVSADEALRRAASRASRTFVWWRSLKDELEQRQGGGALGKLNIRSDPSRLPGQKTNFRDIQKRYAALIRGVEQGIIDDQKRGYIIQEIVTDLLSLTFSAGDVIGSHSIHGRQVDCAFTYKDVRHRIEVKWKSKPFNQANLDALRRILEHAEVRGIVVSMSGFTDEAISYARDISKQRAVIFIDREEVEQVIGGRCRFESLLEWKLVQWRRTGEPYARFPESRPTDGN